MMSTPMSMPSSSAVQHPDQAGVVTSHSAPQPASREGPVFGTAPANVGRPRRTDLAPVLVDVIFETIERIREQDDTVLLLEQNALAALEIAEFLYVLEFGKLNVLGEAPKLLDESFVTAANLEGHW